MQKILTIALFASKKKNGLKAALQALGAYENRIEIVYHLYGGEMFKGSSAYTGLSLDDYSKFVKMAAALGKGTYFLCTDCDIEIDDGAFNAFLDRLENSKADVIRFEKPVLSPVAAVKLAEVKKLNFKENVVDGAQYALSCALINAKLCDKCASPFNFSGGDSLKYYAEHFELLDNSAELFARSFFENKSRLSSTVYKAAFEEVCAANAKRYLCAIYLSLTGKYPLEKLLAFDARLKEKAIIYNGIDKFFPVGSLNKLRQKGFDKLPFITVWQIKSYFK